MNVEKRKRVHLDEGRGNSGADDVCWRKRCGTGGRLQSVVFDSDRNVTNQNLAKIVVDPEAKKTPPPPNAPSKR